MTAGASRFTQVLVWTLRGALAALFLFAAIMKLSNQPMMVQEFEIVGLGQGFRYLTGVLEAAGAIAILVPAVSVWGAILLLLIDIGALIAQVTVIHQDWIHTVVIALVIGLAIHLQRRQLGDLISRRIQ